jgi:hypothetical protein
MDYDYSSYAIIVKTILEHRVYDPDNLEMGVNISPLPGLKIVFDGYGLDPETGEPDNKNLECYALFVHKDSAKRHFVFPEHETEEVSYGELIVQRPDEEVCITVWHDVERGRWNVPPIEDAMAGETYMTVEMVVSALSAIYDKNYS